MTQSQVIANNQSLSMFTDKSQLNGTDSMMTQSKTTPLDESQLSVTNTTLTNLVEMADESTVELGPADLDPIPN